MSVNYTPSFENYTGQGKFRFWCQTVLPLVYDDALSYMELLNKMVIYLNNTIQDVAAMEDNVDALLTAYNQLQEYVNDYFDNLDVQQEINHKLDSLVEDGTMDTLIEPFITLQLPGLVQTDLPGVVENQIGGVVANQIDNVVGDQIGGVVAEQIPSQVTGWLNDNVTPVGSAVVVDSSLTITGAAADAKVVGDELDEIKDALTYNVTAEFYKDNLLFSANFVFGKTFYAGVEGAYSHYSYAIVPVTPGTTYYIFGLIRYLSTATTGIASYSSGKLNDTYTADFTGDLYITFYNSNPDWVVSLSNDITNIPGYNTVPFYHDALLHEAGDSERIPLSQKGVSNAIPTVVDSTYFEIGANKYNPEATTVGYLKDNTGAIAVGSYVTSDYIDISGFTHGIYVNKNMRKTLFYNASKEPISDSYVNDTVNAGVIDLEDLGSNYKYVRFSFADSFTEIMVIDSATVVPYQPYQLAVKDGRNYFNSNTENAAKAFIDTNYPIDILANKKWAVCGDSFSAGADSGTLSEGIYAGQKIVYPYIIGNRTGMTIYKFFENGRTLAFPAEPGDFVNSLTAEGQSWYYQNIPADSDYITIYLGINDRHHATGNSSDGEDTTGEIPLGTITDDTTATYYGAWNVVLSWLIENRPFAHIGIIITNGVSENYRNAQLAIARKYGIPFIDMNGDDRTPCMIRSSNPNIDASVRNAITLKQRISSTNSHPNNATHQYEATFIENFLRSL